MSIFEEYLNSEFVKNELKKVGETGLLEKSPSVVPKEIPTGMGAGGVPELPSVYPKAPARYGATFSISKESDGVHFSLYLRAGIIMKAEGQELGTKEEVFNYLRKKYPQAPNVEIHKIIQKIMMNPAVRRYMTSRKRSPVRVYHAILNIPQFEGKMPVEIEKFLFTLLHNGVFDPLLRTGIKSQSDLAEFSSRMEEVKQGKMEFYPLKKTYDEPEIPTFEFQEKQLSLNVKRVVKADVPTYWYLNAEEKTIVGPFSSLESATADEDQKLGISEEIPIEFDFGPREEEILEELIPEEEELAMAAGTDMLKKLVALADKMDEKGETETEIVAQLDKLIVTASDLVKSDMVKECHPKGGFTTELTNKVKGDGAKVETLEEQQKKDLEVATTKPTGGLASITACKACGLTHIAAEVKTCPACDKPL